MRLVLLIATIVAISACDRKPSAPPLFELLSPRSTGVQFANNLPEKPEFNILNYLYYYNGAGVAVGDIDNDGLPDLYFTSNLGANRLYRNKGNYQFEDITIRAGVADSIGWKTGVTMADVNGDGRVDIYVSAVDYLSMHGSNVLYINNGNGTFTDRTKEFGLDYSGYSTQALFFDYDSDGDLDMYLLNHSTHTERMIGTYTAREGRNPRAGDRLYRNDGNHFVDVSDAAGVAEQGVDGYGLGVVASDVNMDGCPDLYVANDFQGNDYLYINNCNGTFSETIAAATHHTSRFSMGVDAADFNNDGRPDIVSLDMLPDREEVLKTSANAESFNVYNLKLQAGYEPQFARNNLQLNRGGGHFSEIGYLAGVSATDWSWSALFADLDNDGEKDLFITNGIYRRPNDLDYINYVSNDAIQASLAKGINESNLSLLQKMPQIPLANYAFHNNGDLTFTNSATAWGLDQPGFSNGAAYVDLNNSGALDLVVNNVNAPASIYRNAARSGNGNAYLTVALKGTGANTAGVGAKVIVRQGGARQLLEQMPTRGFQSSSDPRLHFGLGKATRLDSLIVIWPDRKFQVLTNVAVNRMITLSQSEAAGRYDYAAKPAESPLFTDAPDNAGVEFTHREDTFFDYNREPLMPHLVSTEGPALAVGDVNGDGLDDFYIGGAKWQRGALYVQDARGDFHVSPQTALAADSLNEDVDATFFDANGDGHPDLFVVSGGNELWGEQPALQDRLYLNDGKGNYARAALPAYFHNGGCVAAGDFNGDGRPDVFAGSRVESRSYGVIPRSYLLQNDGSAHFSDVTAQSAPDLAQAGMVSSCVATDYDNDGRDDLVVAGEWMPVRIFHQERGRLVERTREAGLAGTNGWWSRIAAADLRGNGRKDLILGNLGLNSYLKASAKEPARMYVGEFAKNGVMQQILTFYKHGVSYPVAGRDEIVRMIPALRAKYPSYASFGAAKAEDILPPDDLKAAQVREAFTFASGVALNDGNGTFRIRALPEEAQLSPIYGIASGDFDGDGKPDLLLGGNFNGVTPLYGRYDASYGELMRGDGAGAFTAVQNSGSGLFIDGEVRRIGIARRGDGGKSIIVARNNDKVQIIRAMVPGAKRGATR